MERLRITGAQAQEALAAVREVFAAYEGWGAPVVREDFECGGRERTAIVWEEGPQGWALPFVRHERAQALLDLGIGCDAYNDWVVILFPEML